MKHKIKTICNRDCPDSCGVVTEVEDGRIVSHKGDPDHGITAGFLCYRGNHYLERMYSKDRILYPQIKRNSKWAPISWDGALDLCAEKLSFYKEEFGPLAIAYLSYSGIKGQVAKLMAHKFWAHLGGATLLKGGTSVEASHQAQSLDFGGPCTHAPEDLTNSKAIVIWGKNVKITRVHAWPFISKAKKQGAKLVVIDPVACATAKSADIHLAIRPGSDAMLALAVGRILLEKNALDQEFIQSHSNGFKAYKEQVLSVSLKEAAKAADLGLNQIHELAELYAETKPLAAMIGLGPSYWKNAGAAVRLIDALSAMTGNIGIPGGGAHTDIFGAQNLDLTPFKEVPKRENRTLLLPRLGEELLAADPPVKAGFMAGINPAATCPDTGRVYEALKSLEFLVAVDQFMTASTEPADLFLPCATYLEMEDLVTAYGHHWLGINQGVVPPLGEVKSDTEIFQALADRLGFGKELQGAPKQWIDCFLKPLNGYGVNYETLKQGARPDPLAQPVPFANGSFGTPSKKYEFITEIPIAPAQVEKGFIRLMATKTLKMVNAQINDKDLPNEPVARIHPDTLKEWGLDQEERVVVESPVGSVCVRVETDPSMRRDFLLFNPAAWRNDLQGVNQLRESYVCDMGDAAAMHETQVRLRRL